MIDHGLVSVTFRELAPGQIVDFVAKAGLSAVEWGGDVHVPPGDAKLAKEVRQMTIDSGLRVASYGSYYRSEGDEAFEPVLETALVLAAPTIRVWAGHKGSADAGPRDRQTVIADLCRIARLALSHKTTISLEYHGGTLTDTPDSVDRLLDELDGCDAEAARNIFLYWQPSRAHSPEQRLESLRRVLARLSNLHVFHWVEHERLPLAEGQVDWREYLALANSTGRGHAAMLEFVRDDSPERFLQDAATLKDLIASR